MLLNVTFDLGNMSACHKAYSQSLEDIVRETTRTPCDPFSDNFRITVDVTLTDRIGYVSLTVSWLINGHNFDMITIFVGVLVRR